MILIQSLWLVYLCMKDMLSSIYNNVKWITIRWRVCFWVSTVPAALLALLMEFCAESPHWLLKVRIVHADPFMVNIYIFSAYLFTTIENIMSNRSQKSGFPLSSRTFPLHLNPHVFVKVKGLTNIKMHLKSHVFVVSKHWTDLLRSLYGLLERI